MEQILKRILDFQKFSPNERLSAIISDVEKNYKALDDDDLSLVAAAGEPDLTNDIREKNNDRTGRSI